MAVPVNVYVALSGGVDSSVALALLRDEGYDVTGVYFKTYKPNGDPTYCREQGTSAERVCETLSVPFKVFDLQDEYREKVFEYMLSEYRAGRTPNPDIICNREIKFGLFAQRAFADGAQMIATGHYARVADGQLLQARDTNKDQSYFLSQVRKEVLERTLFPLGELHKQETRRLAQQYGLHTAEKPDSQGLCFIGHEIDVKSFLKRYIPEHAGALLDVAGEVIGTHEGAEFYTIGERHGFTIDARYQSPHMAPLFVITKDIHANTVTVGTATELQHQSPTSVRLTHTNWLQEPVEGREYACRIRHRGVRVPCVLHDEELTFLEPPHAPSPGQFVALYDGDMCLGGGVMT